jgi:hypothetical protein
MSDNPQTTKGRYPRGYPLTIDEIMEIKAARGDFPQRDLAAHYLVPISEIRSAQRRKLKPEEIRKRKNIDRMSENWCAPVRRRRESQRDRA